MDTDEPTYGATIVATRTVGADMSQYIQKTDLFSVFRELSDEDLDGINCNLKKGKNRTRVQFIMPTQHSTTCDQHGMKVE